jgi:small subunit ribosomal protein S11
MFPLRASTSPIRALLERECATASSSRSFGTSSLRLVGSNTITPLDDIINRSTRSPGAISSQTRAQAAEKKSTATHSLHVKSSRNNIILTYTDNSKGGKVFRTITGGIDKDFKKANRSSYEAAHQAALKVFNAIEEHGKSTIRIAFNGIFGQGREAVAAALAGPEGVRIRNRIVKVEDRTPIKIGGTRAKKPRRL